MLTALLKGGRGCAWKKPADAAALRSTSSAAPSHLSARGCAGSTRTVPSPCLVMRPVRVISPSMAPNGSCSASPATRRARNTPNTELSSPESISGRASRYFQSMRPRMASAAWRSDNPATSCSKVTRAKRLGASAGCPRAENKGTKRWSATIGPSPSRKLRSSEPRGKAAQAMRLHLVWKVAGWGATTWDVPRRRDELQHLLDREAGLSFASRVAPESGAGSGAGALSLPDRQRVRLGQILQAIAAVLRLAMRDDRDSSEEVDGGGHCDLEGRRDDARSPITLPGTNLPRRRGTSGPAHRQRSWRADPDRHRRAWRNRGRGSRSAGGCRA